LLAESLRDLPPAEDAIAAALKYRFGRQSRDDVTDPSVLAERLARAAVKCHSIHGKDEWPGPNRWLRDLLFTAEFLAREGRVASGDDKKGIRA
jgi:hypothetical protein